MESLVTQLERLHTLHQQGALSDEEYQHAKDLVLAAPSVVGKVEDDGAEQRRVAASKEAMVRAFFAAGMTFAGLLVLLAADSNRHGGLLFCAFVSMGFFLWIAMRMWQKLSASTSAVLPMKKMPSQPMVMARVRHRTLQ